jgi:cyclopropane fatty-acyl-phospholipid synthase-like methyltransferase
MSGNSVQSKPDAYWDRAGAQGYARAMYRSADVESHVRGRLWNIAIDIADELGVPPDGRVIDVGCGDGAFANQVLAARYRAVDGIDKSEMAIKRAQTEAKENTSYRAVDLVTFNYNSLPRYDAAFLLGILHHVKHATSSIVRALAQRTNRMIVLEPNGSHVMRKLLELTPAYREAGEDSFRTKQLIAVFENAGWETMIHRRLNLFPNFTPAFIYRWLGPIEPKIEANPFWNALCTVDMYGLANHSPQ